MLTQAIPPQPFRPYGQSSGAMPGAQMMPPPRLPPPNMYPPGFNQFKQINIPPPSMIPPVSMGTDAFPQTLTGAHSAFPTNQQMLDFDARRQQRKNLQRRTVDYNASIVQEIKNRIWKKTANAVPFIQPDVLYYNDLVSPRSLIENPVNSVTTRFVRTATNKIRCPLFSLSWTPEGRRLITGASSGEFTLWGGLTFNFETVLQAHESAVRAMQWSHNDTWLLSADHSGLVKYWQSNMNNVKTLQCHNDAVRGVSFSPTDNKFATCSDDGTVKIWDFYRCFEERVLRGHGADVKCIDWHPSKSLLVSGSKDSQQPLKLWDPKSGASLSTIHIHKSTVMDLQWNCNGNWLLTASRDHLIKVFDIRAMKEIQTFRGHKKEATAVDWHPVHESLFASGGSDGAIMFWNMGSMKELGSMDHAHDAMIWSVRWHPLGHILASGSNDHTCKFWTRNRPGDKMRDKFNLNTNPLGDDDYEYDIPTSSMSAGQSSTTATLTSAEEALPGLSMIISSPSTSTISSLTSTGIPGIDMTFPLPEKTNSGSQSNFNQLKTIRPSAFKLPNRKSSIIDKTDHNKVTSTFKIPNAEEVREILEGKPAGKFQGVSGTGRGLLPTPSKDFKLDVIPNASMNTFEVEAGMVIEAEQVWLDEKMIMMEEERLAAENQGRKRGRKGNYQFQGQDDVFIGGRDSSQFFEGGIPKRVLHSNRGRFEEESMERESDHAPPNWREPPEKKRLIQGQQQTFNHRDQQSPQIADERVDFKPHFSTNRSRPLSLSNVNVPFDNRDGFLSHENSSFRSQQNHPDDDRPGPKPNGSPRGEGLWNERDGNMGVVSSRGRRRGMLNQSMHRNNPHFTHTEPPNNNQYDAPSHTNAMEPLSALSWRQSETAEANREKSTPTSQEPSSNEWDNENFIPGQRRGPHPLLRRGRGGGTFAGRRPTSFEGRGLPSSPGETRMSAANERTMSNDDLSSPSRREKPKLRGLMDDININFPNEKQIWQLDSNAKGT